MYQTIFNAIQQISEIGQQIISWAWNDATIEQLIVVMIGWKMLDNFCYAIKPYIEAANNKVNQLNDWLLNKSQTSKAIKRLVK